MLNIKIENFEGPFDLLLHLIKKNEMDIYDIKIYDITTQYLKYLNEMKEMDLEITSEFIVMAATLLEIKSRMLLPTIKEDDQSDEIDDPRNELINKLIEYRKFKMVAEFLECREEKTGIVFKKKPEIIEEDKNISKEDILKGMSILQLFNLYNCLISNFKNKMNTENELDKRISLDRFKVEDKMDEIIKIIINNKKTCFSEVINNCTSKLEKVVTFLALLELIRLRLIYAIQENNFTEIYMEEISNNGQ